MEYKFELTNISEDVITTSVFDHKLYVHFNTFAESSTSGTLYKYKDEPTSGWHELGSDDGLSENQNVMNGTVTSVDENGNQFTTTITGGEEDKWYYWNGNSWILCSEEDHEECLALGTKIAMADGSYKNIEDIKIGDSVKTFNHELGKYTSEEVYFAYKGEDKQKSFTLHFEDGSELSIVGLHDLFENESNRYVTIKNSDAKTFIGKHFYNAKENRFVELVDVTFNDEEVEYYSIYTKHNFNCIANDVLTVADDVDFFLNIYEFKEDLSANLDTLNKDINNYGLCDYSMFKVLDKEVYDYCNVKYLNIMVGKGLTTFEKIKEDYLNNLK